ncbi:hypothetical protein BH10ACT3_BH10ACT3_01570 [soil metagenome]
MSVFTALMLSVGVVIGGTALAPAAGAQECPGRVSTAVTSESLPGGTWSVTDGCLPTESFFEYSDGDIRAQVGLSSVTYDDGHVGRVAAGMLTLGGGTGLAIVGVEDEATGRIKWSAVLGDYNDDGSVRTVGGDGVTLFPTESAQIQLSMSGTGTDVTAMVNDQLNGSTTTTIDPSATTVPDTAPTESTVPSTTVPTDDSTPATTAPETDDPSPSTTAPLALSTTTTTTTPSSTTTTPKG